MKRIIIFLLFASFVNLTISLKSIAQSSSSSSGGQIFSVEDQLNELEQNTSDLIEKLSKQKDKKSRTTAKRVKAIERKIIRALNSVPPNKCLDKLKIAMEDFFGLVSELGSGIACGPPILPPFLRTENQVITPDCALPPTTDSLNGPFSDVNPVYDDARNIFMIDSNENDIPDACE